MRKRIQKRFALSEKGANDFLKGVLWTTFFDIALMLPAVLIFIFLDEYLKKVFDPTESLKHGLWYFVLLGAGFMVIMYIIAIIQYKSTFTTVYEESANRRISLAEKLRKLPLAFFGEKNLSDLTSTIMDDSTEMEHTFSHAVPQLFASVISILFIALGLFFYNWQLSLALFWVVPFAAAIILISKKFQHEANKTIYLKKRDVTEKIQEGLDTVQEIKAYNGEEKYIAELNEKADSYEKHLIKGELITGALVNSAQSFLKLGMASVIIIGASLFLSGTVELITYLIFLMVASRVYAPVNEVFNNLAALYYLDVRINRIREMEALPVQQGTANFNPDGFDITFEKVNFSYEDGKQVLKNVSFTAKQGEITALVGPC